MRVHEQASWQRPDDDVYEPLLIEKDESTVEVDVDGLPDELTRDEVTLPSVDEPEVAAHYTRLSQMTYGIENGPYPLGSCTMKYNPKFTERLAGDERAHLHPDRPDQTCQGILEIMYRLQDYLGRIAGMDAVSLQPPAGAAGEFTGIRICHAYHEDNGEAETRSEVIVPESAHGTNFASAAMGGYEVVTVPSNEEGRVDLEALEAALGPETAALMLTNPNTLGVIEREIETMASMVHDAGGLLYYDGANLNALLGRARPGDMGFDITHYNVHKTFATPHGGGGPGAGPVGVIDELAGYLPEPVVERDPDGTFKRVSPAHSIGKVHGYDGNWLVLLKAYAYIARLGDEGLLDTSAKAVLNANYLAEQLTDYDIPYGPVQHEFVASAGDQDAGEIARAMLDYGVHPPTTKWPELVDEALMTEPTEVETKQSLDALAEAFQAVSDLDDEELAEHPKRMSGAKIDQVAAARSPTLSWREL